ncbi:MAG: EamA family transporter [Eubacteriales bacterium]|nr:EamA family transporter [Eubacteriales bacterium]
MNLDPLAIRNLLIWIALAVCNTILLGGVPCWMRGGAKSADPSAAAAVFALVLTIAGAALLYVCGGFETLLSLSAMQIVWLGVCGLLSALTWLSLFTALTGGRVSKVIPVLLLSQLLTLAASHFLFGAPMGLWKICCIVLTLLGIVFIESKTQQLQSQLWFVYALIAVAAATGLSLVRRGFLGDAFDEKVLLAGRAAFAAVFLWIFVFVRGKNRLLQYVQPRAWVSIFFAAVFFAGSFAATYFASRRGEMSTLAPVGVLSFLFAMLFARIFQKEKQPGAAIFGTLLVLLGQFGILMGF